MLRALPLALAGLCAASCAWSVPADPGENAARRGALGPLSAGSGAAPVAGDPEAGRLYYARCAQCHEAVAPRAHPAADWPALVDRYAPRAGLFGAERAKVLAWLQAQAR